jgi:hypothetical protein
MRIMKALRIALPTGVVAFFLGLSACQKEGPAERAGKALDQSAERAGEKMEDATDKAADALKRSGEKAKDKLDR